MAHPTGPGKIREAASVSRIKGSGYGSINVRVA